MTDTTIPAYDQTKADAAHIWSDERPATLPAKGLLVLVGNDCPHCHKMLASNGYAQTTADGQPIIYVDMRTEAGFAYFEKMGLAVGEDGKSLTIDQKPAGQVGLPTVLSIDAGKITGVIATGETAAIEFFAPKSATAPATGTAPATTTYDVAKANAAGIWNDEHPATLPDKAVIALVANKWESSQNTVADHGYAQTTRDGKPIIYIDMQSEEGLNYFRSLKLSSKKPAEGSQYPNLMLGENSLGEFALPTLLSVDGKKIVGIAATGFEDANQFLTAEVAAAAATPAAVAAKPVATVATEAPPAPATAAPAPAATPANNMSASNEAYNLMSGIRAAALRGDAGARDLIANLDGQAGFSVNDLMKLEVMGADKLPELRQFAQTLKEGGVAISESSATALPAPGTAAPSRVTSGR